MVGKNLFWTSPGDPNPSPSEIPGPNRWTVYVTGDAMALPAGPSIDFRVVGQERSGDKVEELGRATSWARLQLDRAGPRAGDSSVTTRSDQSEGQV